MIHAYSESYLYDAKQNLAECFDYAISNCRFKNIFAKQYVAVNVEELNKLEDGAEVTAETLKANGIISKTLDGVKILGRGELNKKLTVKVAKMSASAKEKIEKAGGKAEVM